MLKFVLKQSRKRRTAVHSHGDHDGLTGNPLATIASIPRPPSGNQFWPLERFEASDGPQVAVAPQSATEDNNSESRESPLADSPALPDDWNLRLKGPSWPGMDIFDSASEDMKRKRNQRKDHSVLQKMRHDSISVEPLESVWNKDLDLERRRSVYDSPTPPPEDDDTVSIGAPVGFRFKRCSHLLGFRKGLLSEAQQDCQSLQISCKRT